MRILITFQVTVEIIEGGGVRTAVKSTVSHAVPISSSAAIYVM